MSDRESLEMAAKAAGIKNLRCSDLLIRAGRCYYTIGDENDGQIQRWNPLIDDGDALRLAVKLRLTVYQWAHEVCVCNEKGTIDESVVPNEDVYAATRRAIVSAAAEIGRSIK
jgi:hypothetical protein